MDAEGPGMVTHFWLTVPDRTDAGPFVLRDLVLRAYWDNEPGPSVEVPLGDFFCNGFATRCLVTSLPITVAPTGGMNCYFPMPFERRARLTITSEHPGPIDALFYQVDYQLFDKSAGPLPYFHAQWRRSNGGEPGTDHVILDGVRGKGAYVGTFLGVACLERFWWGEGEVKFYLDGDREHPTICGTGLEDYAGGAWGFQDILAAGADPIAATYSSSFLGHPQYLTTDPSRWSPYVTASVPQHGIYRWHILDPIYFGQTLRVTVQQIGHDGRELFERSDDVSSVAYWYQDVPQRPAPVLPSASDRRPR